MLSKLIKLESLKLNLRHNNSNSTRSISSLDSLPFFSHPLENLQNLQRITLIFEDFEFGLDGGKALLKGISLLSNLSDLEIKCNPKSIMSPETIETFCQNLKSSPSFDTFKLKF